MKEILYHHLSSHWPQKQCLEHLSCDVFTVSHSFTVIPFKDTAAKMI